MYARTDWILMWQVLGKGVQGVYKSRCERGQGKGLVTILICDSSSSYLPLLW